MLRRPDCCPECGAATPRRIYYGRPTPETWEIIHRGEALPGGNVLSAGMPDWECAKCHREWADESDPARQEMQATLLRLSEPRPPPDPPPLTKTSAGQFERLWNIQFSRVVPFVDLAFAQRVQKRAGDLLAAQHSPEGDQPLEVTAARTTPRSLAVRIGRASQQSKHQADACVMRVLETELGRITKLQGSPPSLWGDWPLPPTVKAG